MAESVASKEEKEDEPTTYEEKFHACGYECEWKLNVNEYCSENLFVSDMLH